MEKAVGSIVISKIADNIISPLGTSSEENFDALVRGESRLALHEDAFGVPEPFCASLFDRKAVLELFLLECGDAPELTFFEKLCILSAHNALNSCKISAADEDLVFVLSTTKGNVDCLENDADDPRCYLYESAAKIAGWFGNKNAAIVVSNACISGVCAQITAVRELLSGRCRYAVVIGCDVLSKFVVSGFQSFKALSQDVCRPYDADRCGLNLGEAVGTIILKTDGEAQEGAWQFTACSIHNDANHISGPSRTGEGLFRVLDDILRHVNAEDLAFVNVHGTSTPYNDEMESIAISRAQLSDTPVNGLKAYYGHTLGAAGIIETILSMKAVEDGIVPATKGYERPGTTHAVNISKEHRRTDKQAFIKILSGFGGCNAGIAYRKGGAL